MKSIQIILAKVAAVLAVTGFAGTISSASLAADGLMSSTDLEKLNWVDRGPVKIVNLWGGDDSGESAFLLKIGPDFKGGKHLHSEDYRGVTLQGTWAKTWADGKVEKFPVGSYLKQPKNKWHIDGCAGPEMCIFLIHFEGPRDITMFAED